MMNSPRINLAALARLERDFERILASLSTHKHDLTTRQVRAFLILGKASLEDEPLTTQDLKRMLGMSAQTTHNAVEHFVQAGYVERRRSFTDARAKELVLTERGEQALRRFIDG